MAGLAIVPGRGRKPDPLKVRSRNANIPKFSELLDIEPPSYMDNMKYASMIWRSVVPELLENELLKITDIHNLEVFCTAYETYRMCQIEVAKDGVTVEGASGSLVKNPALTALNEAVRQMATFGSLLGLDPTSRLRLTGAAKDNTPSNPFGRI